MKNILTLFFLLIFIFNSTAQFKLGKLSPPENFIYLTDSTLLKEGEFVIEKKFSRSYFYYPNGDGINFHLISFYQDKNGYFAMKPGKTLFGQNFYDPIKRFEEGKIDLFKKTTSTYDGKRNNRFTSYYYSKGFEGLNSLNYKNLKRDLILSNDESLKIHNELILSHLEKGKKNKKIGNTLLWSGLGIFVAGIGMTEAGKDNNSLKLLGNITAGIGLVGAISSLIIQSKPSYLNAIREYNKFY